MKAIMKRMAHPLRPRAACLALGVSIATLLAPQAAPAGTADVAPAAQAVREPVEGTIRETRVVEGVVYVSVSVGTDDGVSRGTRLRVYGGRSGREILGTVVITNVEPEEAIGRVTGARAAEVRAKDNVRSEERVASPPLIVPVSVRSGR